MTVAPARSAATGPGRTHRPGVEPTQTVTAVLVVHNGEQWLVDSLDALSLQTRPPDRLLLVDTGSTDHSVQILRRHAGIRSVVPDVTVLQAGEDATFEEAVQLAVERPAAGGDADGAGATEAVDAVDAADRRHQWLWLLHDDTAPAPLALARLLEACRRSPSVAIAGPKQLLWNDPRRLRSIGLQRTRSGRLMDGPVVGEHDQGQHDHLTDVLGVGSAGMLVRRDVLDELGGFDPTFRGGADLDLSWRAHLAGHRVVLVPRAGVREAAATAGGRRTGGAGRAEARAARRRQARRVALTRCSLLALPVLTAWIALGAVAGALGLLLLKRPRRAWAELGDLGVLGAAWRTCGARWRFRGRRQVRRRDLQSLFVSHGASLRHLLEALADGTAAGAPARRHTAAREEAPETGPVAAESEHLATLSPPWPRRAVRHPGTLAVLAATALTVATWRGLLSSSAFSGTGFGLAGGALTGTAADASGLWHAWLDSWHGSGLGEAGEAAPFLPVLAGATWLVERVPWVSADGSPAGTAIAWLFFIAMPLSAWSAYLAGRVATRARWPRAWAALAWACVPTLTGALTGGRLGAVVAHVLLPLVVAGFAVVLGRRAGVAATFATALALAVTGAFDPPLLVLGTLTAVLVVLFGGGWSITRLLRGLVLAVVPLALVGPWLLRCVGEPRLLLAGPGLTRWGGDATPAWHLALLDPGGPGHGLVWASVPFVLLGLVGLARRRVPGHALGRLALLALVGLALALAASHVLLAPDPGDRGAGAVRPWAGTGVELLTLALLASAVVGLPFLTDRRWWRRSRSRAAVGVPLATLAVAGLLASAGYAGWAGAGPHLTPATGSVPPIAAEQASSTLANRLLVLDRQDGVVGYRLLGREPGPVARSLPLGSRSPDPLLRQTVRQALSRTSPADANAVRRELSGLGVGFVAYRGTEDDALVRHLDSTAGLTRLGSQDGLVLWRVLPGDDGGAQALAPSRVRVVTPDGATHAVDVTGAHAATHTTLPPGSQRSLVVAEPPAWAAHATVLVDGRTAGRVAGADQPTYRIPAGAADLRITVEPAHPTWRWVQLGLLLLTAFLSVPVGARRSGRTR